MIEDETLEFVKTNMNHLPMYYIPGQEFKWADFKLSTNTTFNTN
jgi:hypothetical protein